jgi:hypothetical protein
MRVFIKREFYMNAERQFEPRLADYLIVQPGLTDAEIAARGRQEFGPSYIWSRRTAKACSNCDSLVALTRSATEVAELHHRVNELIEQLYPRFIDRRYTRFGTKLIEIWPDTRPTEVYDLGDINHEYEDEPLFDFTVRVEETGVGRVIRRRREVTSDGNY